jgi:monofunctional biosynthetic peptidoglycan transglycosylase
MLIRWVRQLVKDIAQAVPQRWQRYTRYFRWGIRIGIMLFCIEIGYVWGLMPDWEQFTHGPIQKSRMMMDYEYEREQHPNWPALRWFPVSIELMPNQLTRAVIVAEDSRFYQHKGFDQEAIKRAMEYNLSKGRFAYGASTISQQTIKNFLLNPSKNPLRKLHEAILTTSMERNVGKQRILEMYLNIAEFGRGIYGVEAASRYYFGKSVAELNINQAIELAATLPSPIKNNPKSRSKQFLQHLDKIRAHLGYP